METYVTFTNSNNNIIYNYMKKVLIFLLIVLFTSCVSTNKFARYHYKSYQHSAIHSSKVTAEDYDYVYKHSPKHIQVQLDSKQFKIHKVYQPGATFYCLVDAYYKGQIGDTDVKFTIKQNITLKAIR